MRIFLMFALSCLLMFSAAPDSSAQSLFSQASGSQDDGNAELSETLRLAGRIANGCDQIALTVDDHHAHTVFGGKAQVF